MPRLPVSPATASFADRQTGSGRTQPSILFLLKGYPRLSETFIAQEIRALEERGLPVRIVSLRFPTDKHVHPIHREIVAPVTYLPEYLIQEPGRVLRGWWRARRLPGYRRALRVWLGDLRRDFTTNRGRRFGQACVLAAEIVAGRHGDVRRLHAHFLHTPAAVAYYASLMTGIPWSCSAHAKDIWTTPDWEKREKLTSLDWLVTCTASGHRHLQDLAAEPAKLSLVYHGLDFRRFPLPAQDQAAAPLSPDKERSGKERPGKEARPLVILSVGRAVPKKGYDDLLRALARLPAELDWRFQHIGGGPELERLKSLAVELRIADRVAWRGAQPQLEVLAAYRAADLFVLASCIAEDGDRDGLPNVLMEAQSQALPVIATSISGVPELIQDGETGLLVPPNDPEALAGAIAGLLPDPARRRALADAGAQRLRAHFAMESGIDDLARRFAPDLGQDINQATLADQESAARQSVR